MKRFQNILMAVAVSALAVVSCAKEEVASESNISEDKVYEYFFTLGEGDTKATLEEGNVVTWSSNDDDYLGVLCKYTDESYSYAQNNTKSQIKHAENNQPAQFNIKSYKALTKDTEIYCYFPFEDGSKFETSAAVKLYIPTQQNNSINDMPMASKPFIVPQDIAGSTTTAVGDIYMLMLGSIARYKIFSSNTDYQGETIKSVSFSTESTTIAGKFGIDIGKINTSDPSTLEFEISENKSNSIEESVADKTVTGDKEDGIVDMVIAPGTYSGTLTIATSAASYEFTLTDKEFQRAHIKPFSVNLANGTRTEKPISHNFELVETDLGDDWSGEYLIVYNNTYAMNTHSANQDANTFATYTDISNYYNSTDKSIAANDFTNALIYTAEKKTNGYSLYCNADESYLGITSGTTSTGAKLRWNTSYSASDCDWKLGVGTIQNVGSSTLYIRWNNNSGSYRFATYKVDGQQAIQLFRLPSTAPKIMSGEIDEFPARSTSGRYTVQTKNITTDLEILDWDGVDFDELDIENGNEIVYTVSDNGSTSAKEGTITVALASDHSVTGTITVSQAAAVFTAARISVDLKAAANSQTTVKITSDFDWTISGVGEGYTVSPMSFTYNPEATEPGKKTITIKANNANDGDATLELGIFKIVNSKNELGSIEITVNQLSSKLPAPTIVNVSGNNKDKQATIQWNKVTNATAYTYYLIDDDASEITSSRATTTDNNVLSATVDIPEYGKNYYFCIFAVGDGDEWINSSESISDAINLTEPVVPIGFEPGTVLFHETFGDNSNSARAWSDTYSVKSGETSVYSGVSYTMTNVKQGKNTTGQTKSGLNQSTAGTDAVFELGPLNVANCTNMQVTYYWNAASTKGTYNTELYYKTSKNGTYTKIDGSGTGATKFVQRVYNLPEAAQVETLYLKVVWNTSNTQAIIDEFELKIKD